MNNQRLSDLRSLLDNFRVNFTNSLTREEKSALIKTILTVDLQILERIPTIEVLKND